MKSFSRSKQGFTPSHFSKKRGTGFTLLLSVLIGSVLLSLGLSIFLLTIRELVLSTTGRDSQFAFYAADAGGECALYWYLQRDACSTTTASTITCNNDASNPGNTNMTVGGAGWDVPSVFALSFLPDSYCTVISVTKTKTGESYRTIIESRGYNFGAKVGSSCTSADPRRLERAIRVTY